MYETFGLEHDCTDAEIVESYTYMKEEYKGKKSALKVIKMIYATLGNKEKRKEYDVFLANRNQFAVKLDEDDYGGQDDNEYELTEDEKREQKKREKDNWKK